MAATDEDGSAFLPQAQPLGVFKDLAQDSTGFRERWGDLFLVASGEPTDVKRLPMKTQMLSAEDSSSTLDLVFNIIPVRKREGSRMPYISIGRTDTNDIVIRDTTVSKSHAIVRETDGKLVLQDNGSRNGTRHNGVDVPARGDGPGVEVSGGAVVEFGSVTMTLLDADSVMALAERGSHF